MSLFENKKILIAGGAGFVGSNLTRAVSQQSPSQIFVVDNLLSSEKENIRDIANVEFIQASIADDAVLHRLYEVGVDFIFHLATYHGNQSSIHDPIADHNNNLITSIKLFDKFKNDARVQKIVYSAAGCAVAEKLVTEASATVEEDIVSLKMDSPYSISKIVGEFYAVYYHKQHQTPIVRARFQNVYGPGEVLGAGQWRGTPATVWRNVTPTFVYKALNGMALQLENAGSGSRDFIFVEDIVYGLIACAEFGTAGEVYNLASGKETTIKEWAELILDLTESSSHLEILPKRDWDTSIKRFGSTVKSKEQLHFEAKTQAVEGLRKTIQWTEANMEFIQKCMDKHKGHLTV
ncbi:MAG: NAD-dependent epimerase/dehydratase family protein [Saprospiraceae bacterium]|nr:NAD-dependent epimerase/dehydratase family protein [Saprospiraceae bacterium]